MGWRQLQFPLLDVGKRVEVLHPVNRDITCPQCGRVMSKRAARESLWGRCRACENARLAQP